MKTTRSIAFASLILPLSACIGLAAAASENWDTHCAKCHGATGNADTKMGKKLKIKDYTDAKSLAAVNDEELLKAIIDGVKDKDGKVLMNGYKEKVSADEAKDLVKKVREFAKK